MARILITGGAGFIGSHTCVVLIEAGHDLLVFDSYINSSPIALKRVCKITGISAIEVNQRIQIIKGDISNKSNLDEIFKKAKEEKREIQAVIHFAGLKSVNESIKRPLAYWDTNVNGTANLLLTMESYECKRFIFSSSATIYGKPKSIPIVETEKINPINPYGNTKATVEKILLDLSRSDAEWCIASLRYFNPVGAHPSGLIGEDPNGEPNNLFPIVSKVAIGHKDILEVFGGDWPTKDKTCIRDYIHVMDLAEGHLEALNYLLRKKSEFLTLNLGSGKGHSVLEVVKSFEDTIGEKINYKIVGRRPGDTAKTIADPTQAKKILGWETRRTILDMCSDSWAWQTANPNGYKTGTT